MPDLTITTGQKVMLSVAADAPVGQIVPPPPPVTWTSADNGKVSLASVAGDPYSIIAIGQKVTGGVNVTATNGVLTKNFNVAVVDPAATAFVITNAPPTDKDDLQVGRGRGLGLGYT